mgnify:CR=1 FL=1
MNIFASNDSPIVSASALDDKRVVKMVLETAQMVSAVAHRYGDKGPWYKPTHANHPCTLWAGECDGNLIWLTEHGLFLADEYTKRFDKRHKSTDLLFAGATFAYSGAMPQGKRTEFANCTPYKDMPVTEAYRRYLADKWTADKRPPKWTLAEPPSWFTPPTQN